MIWFFKTNTQVYRGALMRRRERVTANFHLDEDLVLHVDAKAATQARGEHEEIIDLRFALSATGSEL